MRLRNLLLGIADQFPPDRHSRGIFSRRSHYRGGSRKLKVMHATKEIAERAAASLQRNQPGSVFATYKCIFCDGYHVGKNR